MPEYELRGIRVRFPHEAYDCQLEYMTRVIQALQEGKNALLESPTGTGKTLCLLCATLAWRESLEPPQAPDPGQHPDGEVAIHGPTKRQTWAAGVREAAAAGRAAAAGGRLPTIVYSSRTHSQLAQVMGELRNTGYKPRSAILGSRQQLCLNPGVQQLPAGAANQACRAAVASRSCSWFNRVDPFVQRNPDANTEPLEIEALTKLGAGRGPCPFYLSRELARTADLVFLPYNYLLDAKARGGLAMLELQGAVLIFDEAHNVEGVCADAGSFDLSAPFLAGCIAEATEAQAVAVRRQERAPPPGPGEAEANYFELATELRICKEMLRALEDAIAALDCSGQAGFTRGGDFMLQLLAAMGVRGQEDLTRLTGKLDAAAELLAADAAESGRGGRAAGQRLTALIDSLRLLGDSLEPPSPGEPPALGAYRVHVRLERPPGRGGGLPTPTLSYWCFVPGLAMQALSRRRVRSFLLTSGTLSPLASFAAELRLPFPISLENPHVIEPNQVWVGVVAVGPRGAALNSSFSNRSSKAYQEDLGLALENFARIVPGGLLVFFPSYVVLEACVAAWKGSLQGGGGGAATVWERICRHKQPVIEPKESALFSAAAEDYDRKLKDQSLTGAVFFAVCRGKVSEGLDFSDRAGRAVVITGIPFANARDPKVRLKQEVLDEAARKAGGAKRPLGGQPPPARLTGEQWYSQQALRAVNQGVGRVIRHRRDYGAIILCDDRFTAPGNQRQLSAWLRPLVKVQPNFGAAAASLTGFFREREAAAAAAAAAAPPKPKAAAPARDGVFGTVGRRPAPASRQRAQVLQVPTAVDASGLAHMAVSSSRPAELPQGERDLLGVLRSEAGPASARPAAAAACASGAEGSLAEELWDALDRGVAPPARLPPPRPAEAPSKQAPARLSARASTSQPLAVERARHEAAARAQGSSTAAAPSTDPWPARAPVPAQPAPVPAQRPQPQQQQQQQQQSQQQQQREQQRAQEQPEAKPKPKRSTKEYLARLRRDLPEEAYKEILASLAAFKQAGRDGRRLMDRVLGVLCVPGRRHLLAGFADFVPRAEQPWFKACVRTLLEGGAQQPLPAPAGAAQAPSSAAGTAAPAAATQQQQHQQRLPVAQLAQAAHGLAAPQQQSQQQPQRRGSAAGMPLIPAAAPAKPTAALPGRPAAAMHGRPAAAAPGRPAAAAPGRPAAAAQGGPRLTQFTHQGTLERPLAAAGKPAGGSGAAGPGSARQANGGAAAAGSRPAGSAAAAAGSRPLQALQQPPSRPLSSAAAADSKPACAAAGPPLAEAQPRPPVPAGGVRCALCKQMKMQHPYQAKCGHTACMGCWVKALASHRACPVCHQPVQRRHLSVRYFA